jgi:hypothetical protein
VTPLFESALELQTFFEARRWEFCIIGGIAVLRWGEPRLTRDVDVTLLCGFGREQEFITPLLAGGFSGRISDAAAFALRHRVLLLNSRNGVPIDIALGALPFERLAIERSSLFTFEPGCALRTCSAEDLLVHKLFSFRAGDLLDAKGVVSRQHAHLDWDYVETQLAPLAEVKGQPEIMNEFRRLRRDKP